jgi:XRE family aerobic/anaerobic benzoate catabolism transcriptional regulator
MTATSAVSSTAAQDERKSSSDTRAARRGPVSDGVFLAALGKTVRQLREQRGLSRKGLADTADVSERYLAQLEAGNGNASVVLLRRVAAALNVNVVRLLGSEIGAERSRLNSFIESVPERRLEEVMRRLVAEFGSDESVRKKRIALIGLRGAGKSTLGTALAKAMHRPFSELDREIEREAGMALSEIFMLYGPSGYRKLERQCLERIIASQHDVVMSVGGGVVSEADTYQLLLSSCFTIWIKASPAEHMSRVIAQGDLRPMRGHAQAMEDLKAILADRETQYGRADAIVDTTRQSVMKSLAALRSAIAAPVT